MRTKYQKTVNGLRFWSSFKGRDGCRTPMVWSLQAPNGGFSAVQPWLPISHEHLQLAVAAQDDDPDSLVGVSEDEIPERGSGMH